MKVQINTPYWILIFRIKNKQYQCWKYTIFSDLAQLDLSVSQKDETWLPKIAKM